MQKIQILFKNNMENNKKIKLLLKYKNNIFYIYNLIIFELYNIAYFYYYKQ